MSQTVINVPHVSKIEEVSPQNTVALKIHEAITRWSTALLYKMCILPSHQGLYFKIIFSSFTQHMSLDLDLNNFHKM